MAITGPIIPAKSQVPGAVPSITTTIANSLVDTPSTEVDRAVQVGEIVTNVADGKLWLKKADQTFAPLTRSKTLATWTATSINAFTANGGPYPSGIATQANLLVDVGTTGGLHTVLDFKDSPLNDKHAFFQGTVPEGTTFSSLNLILKFASASGTGNVVWGATIQKPSGPADVAYTTESILTASVNATTWTTSIIPLTTPTGLVDGDFYRIKLRRLASTNDTSTQSVYLLSAELRAV